MKSSRGRSSFSIPAWFDWRKVACSTNSLWQNAFNPSLVRLAPGGGGGGAEDDRHFQSQLGSIGARRDVNFLKGVRGFSIPAWFDWRHFQRHNHIWTSPFSIPAWFDWRILYCRRSTRPSTFSIPAWFDWRDVRGVITLYQFPFQSQLGSIGASKREIQLLEEALFSIPAWFDWRAPTYPNSSSPPSFSIPAWFDWRR